MARPLACGAMTGRHRKIPAYGTSTGLLAVLLVVVVVGCVVVATVWVALRSQRLSAPPAQPPGPQVHAAAQSAPVDVTGCGPDLAGALPHVARVSRALQERFEIIRVTAAGDDEDHDLGLGVDFYFTDRDEGDAFTRYLTNNRERLGVNFVMWWRRVSIDGVWHAMSDRGTMGANHYDHVHVSFRSSPPESVPECEE